MKHYVLYIPGLSDHRGTFQQRAVKLWPLYGLRGEFVPMQWNDGEVFEQKQRRILDRIDQLNAEGYEVSLVGTSAGGGAALNVFASVPDKIHRVVVICATIGGGEHYSEHTYRKNPAFRGSMKQISTSLKTLTIDQFQRILAIQPLHDSIVRPSFARLPSGRNRRMFTVGHAFSIGYAITLGMPKTVRFIKRTK